ncbi:MAG: hypothetical protein SGPRY_010439, partial [Prymnesium sp.]
YEMVPILKKSNNFARYVSTVQIAMMRTTDNVEEGVIADHSESESEDDTAMVEDKIGAAPDSPPVGFSYELNPPPLATDEDLQHLVGRHVYHAWDTQDIKGWFVGKISARGVSQRDLARTPTTNFVVTYNRNVTHNRSLHGRVASSWAQRVVAFAEACVTCKIVS